jgi:hypothetical protein
MEIFEHFDTKRKRHFKYPFYTCSFSQPSICELVAALVGQNEHVDCRFGSVSR